MRDYEPRLQELAALRRGWLGDGNGAPVPYELIVATRRLLTWIQREELAEPWMYPTPNGAVQLEWEQRGGIEVLVHDGGYDIDTPEAMETGLCLKRVHVLLRSTLRQPGLASRHHERRR